MKLLPTIASRPAKRAAASYGVLAVFLALAPLTFAACGDDGNVLGSDGGAGGASGGMAGSNSGGSSTAGSAHAGMQSSAGVSSGGSANGGMTTGGTASNAGSANGGTASGGGPNCSTGQCIRANVCLDQCGGDVVVYTGCCACPKNSVEQLTCSGAGGQGSGGQGSTDCAGSTCNASQTCVAYRTVGGTVDLPDQNNHCPTGRHLEGNYCLSDFAYTCAELTGCAAPANTCRCAANTACANTTVCSLPTASAWLDPAAELVCQLLAP
jgi:hypothetical protein